MLQIAKCQGYLRGIVVYAKERVDDEERVKVVDVGQWPDSDKTVTTAQLH